MLERVKAAPKFLVCSLLQLQWRRGIKFFLRPFTSSIPILGCWGAGTSAGGQMGHGYGWGEDLQFLPWGVGVTWSVLKCEHRLMKRPGSNRYYHCLCLYLLKYSQIIFASLSVCTSALWIKMRIWFSHFQCVSLHWIPLQAKLVFVWLSSFSSSVGMDTSNANF